MGHGNTSCDHTYIQAIKQPTLSYITRSVRRRAATSKQGLHALSHRQGAFPQPVPLLRRRFLCELLCLDPLTSLTIVPSWAATGKHESVILSFRTVLAIQRVFALGQATYVPINNSSGLFQAHIRLCSPP